MNANSPDTATRLARQSGLVIAGNAFTLLAGLPFHIYLARVLGAEQLGVFSLFEVIAQTAAALAALGLSYTVVRFIPEHLSLGQHRHVRQLLTALFAVTLLAGVVAAALVAFGGERLVDWIPELRKYSRLFPFVGAMTLLGMLSGLAAQALRAFLDIRWLILVSSFLQLTLKIAIAITLLWLGWELMGYLIAVVASLGLALTGMLWGLRRHLLRLGHTEENVLRKTRGMWWSYSRTMYSSSLLSMAVAPAERFLIGGVLDLASLGIWSAVRQLQSLSQVFLQVIITVIAPMLVGSSAKSEKDEVTHLYRIATDWVGRLGFPLLIFLAIFGDNVLALYGAHFSEGGHWPLLVLLMGQFVNLGTGPVGTLLNYLGQERTMLRLGILSDGLFFLCLLTLAPLLGLVGVAAAAALSTIFSNLAAVRIMKQRLGISWWTARNQRHSLPLLLCLVATLLVSYANLAHGAWDLLLALAATYAVFLLTYVSRGLTSEDKELYRMLRLGLGFANDKRN
jgi:O-antigen/teichoic acid export membrane protein